MSSDIIEHEYNSQEDSEESDDIDSFNFEDIWNKSFHVCHSRPAIPLMTMQLSINSCDNLIALVDSGGTYSAITTNLVNMLGLEIVPQNTVLKVLKDRAIESKGFVNLTLKVGNIVFESFKFVVLPPDIKSKFSILLGIDFITKQRLTLYFKNNVILYTDENKSEFEIDLKVIPNRVTCTKVVCFANKNIVLNKGMIHHLNFYTKDNLSSSLMFYNNSSEKSKVAGLEGIMDKLTNKIYLMTSENKLQINHGDELGTMSGMISSPYTDECPDIEYWNRTTMEESININPNLTKTEKDSVIDMLLQNKQVLGKSGKDLGCISDTRFKIDLIDSTPIYQKPRCFPNPLSDEIEQQCIDLVGLGVTEHSTSAWSSPIVPVRKPDGSLRLCIDYRKLNFVTKNEKFPMPNLQNLVYSLHGAKYFTKLDLIKGYYQILMDDESKELTAFSTSRNQYQFKRLSFGLKNAPAVFQRIMQEILSDVPHDKVLIYLDDVLIIEDSFDKHKELLEKVFTKLKERGVKVNLKKSELFQTQVEYLGHLVGINGISKSPKFIDEIKNYPKPNTVEELRQFLGLVNFQRKFVPRCSIIQKPLSEVSGGRGNRKIIWNREMENTFEHLKEILASDCTLSYPDYSNENNKLQLYVDASGTGAGACLIQKQNEETKIIGYASMAFTITQQKYSTVERELVALRWAVKAFKSFLTGVEFDLWTDHRPLVYLHNMQMVDSRLSRTLSDLAEFNFNIKYLPGKENTAADCLSRMYNGDHSGVPLINDVTDLPVGLVHDGPLITGGPNSLIESLLRGLHTLEIPDVPVSHLILRNILVDELLSHATRYKLKLTKNVTKSIKAMRFPNKMPIMDVVLAFCFLYKVKVFIYFHKDKPVIYQNSIDSDDEPIIHLQCLGGIHFNPLVEKKNFNYINFSDCNQIIINQTVDEKNLYFCEEEESDDEEIMVQCFHEYKSNIIIYCNQQKFCCLVDSGAEVSVVSASVLKKLSCETYDKCSHYVKGLDGGLDATLGSIELDLKIGEFKIKPFKFIIVPDNVIPTCILLGIDFLMFNNLVIEGNTETIFQMHTNAPKMLLMQNDNSLMFWLQPIKSKKLPSSSFNNVNLNNSLISPEKILINTQNKELIFEIYKNNIEEEIKLSTMIDLSSVLLIQNNNYAVRTLKNMIINNICIDQWPKFLNVFKRYRKNLKIVNDVLCLNNNNNKVSYVIPFKLFVDVALNFHYKLAHIGRDKLLYLLEEHVWHPHRYKIINDISRSCVDCQLGKISIQKYIPPTNKIITSFPFELSAIDLLSLPKTKNGYVGCLMFADHYSKWVSAAPIRNKTTSHVLSVFKTNILPYLPRVPHKLLTDNGLEFSSSIFTEAMDNLNIKQIFTTPYKPSSNGLVERVNRTINQLLKMLIENPISWDEKLGEALQIYNNTIHTELKLSPSEFLVRNNHSVASNTIGRVAAHQWSSGHPKYSPFRVGQKVIMKLHKVGNRNIDKFTPKYDGPYTVKTVNSNKVTYTIGNQDIIKRAHYTQLYPWVEPPGYVKKHHAYQQLLSGAIDISNESFVDYESKNNNNSLDSLLNVSCDSFDSIDSFDLDSEMYSSDSDIVDIDSKLDYKTQKSGEVLGQNFVKTSLSHSCNICEPKYDNLVNISSNYSNDKDENINYSNITAISGQVHNDLMNSASQIADSINKTIVSLEKFIDDMYESINASFYGFVNNISNVSPVENNIHGNNTINQSSTVKNVRFSTEFSRPHTRSQGPVSKYPNVLKKAI